MADKGGRIPPDGRSPQAPGVGADAKRHDLERPKTPGLHNSDLQQGDVSALEQGQRVAPIRTQAPATPAPQGGAPARGGQPPQGGAQAPDAIDYLGNRLQGTLGVPASAVSQPATPDLRTWLPLLQRLATAPGASGVLAQAYITQMRNAMQETFVHRTPLIDMNQADEDLAALLGV